MGEPFYIEINGEKIKYPMSQKEIKAYPPVDLKKYKPQKEVHALMRAINVLGIRNYNDIKRREKCVLKKLKFWLRKNEKKLASSKMSHLKEACEIIKGFIGPQKLLGNCWLYNCSNVSYADKIRNGAVDKQYLNDLNNENSAEKREELKKQKEKQKKKSVHLMKKDVKQFFLSF